MTRRRFLIEGEVQGVGYRRFVQRTALRLGVAGWVRNLGDGRVEVEVAGTEGAVAELADSLANGPLGANVTKVENAGVLDETASLSGFQIVV